MGWNPRMDKRMGGISLMLCWLALVAAAPAQAVTGSVTAPFADETFGPYRTGTMEMLLVDEKRPELATADPADKRHLMVQIWYPAETDGKRPIAPYILSPDLYTPETGKAWVDIARNSLSRSLLNATIAGSGPLPVVLYNPGAGNPHYGGTYQTEFLASHGYIVVAIGHTGMTGIARFPDGSVYEPRDDAPGFRLPDAQVRGLNDVEQFEARERNSAVNIMPLHVADISFVLDRLATLNTSKGNPLYLRVDLQHVGSLGFSLGGALSLQAARDDPRVKAAVNLDGWLYTDVTITGLNKPVLLMHSSAPEDPATPATRELRLFAESRFWKMLRQTKADWYDVTLTGTVHRYFSDRMLFSEPESQYLPVRQVHAITNNYVLEFFDRYLKDDPLGPLLSGRLSLPETYLIDSASTERALAGTRATSP